LSTCSFSLKSKFLMDTDGSDEEHEGAREREYVLHELFDPRCCKLFSPLFSSQQHDLRLRNIKLSCPQESNGGDDINDPDNQQAIAWSEARDELEARLWTALNPHLSIVASSIRSGTKWPSSCSIFLSVSSACCSAAVRLPNRPGKGL